MSQSGVVDCVFLFVVVLLSAVPYAANLGFHGDDWSNQAELTHYAGLGTARLFVHEWTGDSDALVRPVMVAYDVLCFAAFGRHAAPVHVVNTAVLGLATVLLFLVLMELQIDRWLAFTIALVYGLLPHYATDRFWAASHQAAVCMAFALLGIYALLRSSRPEEPHPKRWLAIAVVANILSVLAYEVALGLIGGAIAWVGWRKVIATRGRPERRLANLGGVVAAAGALLLIGVLKVRLQHRLIYHHHLHAVLSRLGHLSWHAITQAVQFNVWTYGIKLPHVLYRLEQHSALSGAAFATAIAITVCVAAYLWRNMETSAAPGPRMSLGLIARGFIVFGLGFALFFSGLNFNFSSPGINNRVTIASAAGAACVLVGVIGLACWLLKRDALRGRAFSLAIALVCGCNSLAVSGLAFFWTDAASQQAAVLRSVTANVHSLPQGSVLLLDGFCRYSGPGVVFETDWDTTGAIQLALGDYSLNADVVSPNLHFNAAAVDTTMYGQPELHYSYGDRLFVYNIRYRNLTPLPSQAAADAYLRAMNPTGDGGCPAAHEGDGESVL
ncbi:MAG TPA: hypothetical protein VGN01_12480 [Acidobacteriaceae bacterium]